MFRMAPEEDEQQMGAETISKKLNSIVSEEENMSHHLQAPENYTNIAHLEQAAHCMNYNDFPKAKRFRVAASGTRQNYDHFVTHAQLQKHLDCRYYKHSNKYTSYHPEHPIGCQSFQTHGFAGAHVQCEENPTFELYYLKRSTDNAYLPVFSDSSNGRAFRRKSAAYLQEVKRSHIYKTKEDYDKIIVDLSQLGGTNNGKTSSSVQRLFFCFGKLYNTMGEVSHSTKTYTYSAYEPTFAPMPKTFSVGTLNVRSQVEFASLKLNAFFPVLLQVVTQNRMYDQYMTAEFDRYLCDIQSLVFQFDTFKGLKFKHERGEFVGNDVRDAERLVTLLEKLTELLSEVHLRLIVYDWYIGFKYQDVSDVQPMEALNTETDGSGYNGIVNETLKMCNAPEPAQTPTVAIGTTYTNPISRDEQAADCVFKTDHPSLPSASEHVTRHKHVQSGAYAKHNHVSSHAQQQQPLGGEYYKHPNNLTYHSVDPVASQSFPTHGFARTPDQCQNNPTFDLHYPKRPMDTATNGRSFHRKSAGYFQEGKRYHIDNIYKTKQDYDQIVVDLSQLGVTTNGKISSPVQRLFSRFRKLHNAMGEVSNSIKTYPYSAYESTFAPMPKSFRLRTLNVRSQVEFASLKLNAFFAVLLQVVTQHRLYDQNLTAEIVRYLFELLSLVFELDTFKSLKLKHVRGEFVGDVGAHVENLITLLEKMTQLLNDINLRLIVYDWYIGFKHHHDSGVRQMEPQNTQTAGRGEIGIVNETLCAMCNTTLTVPETMQTTTAATGATYANFLARNDFIFNGKDVDDF